MIDLTGHDWTGYTKGSMTITTSGELNGPPVYRAWWALNGGPHVADNGWISNLGTAGAPDWWKIDFGSGKKKFIFAYVVHGMNYQNAVGATWFLQGSNDDSNWNTVSNVTGQTTWASYESKVFYCSPVTTSYRYWRFINQGAGRNYINEFYFFGYPDNGTIAFPQFWVQSFNTAGHT